MSDELIIKFFTLLLVMYGTSLHEMAHAYVATWLGDPTPGQYGRLTLNPIPHLSPVLTAIVLPFVMFMSSGSLFMLATTPINPQRFSRPMRDRALVSVVGPIMNFLFAAVLIALLWSPFIERGTFIWAVFIHASRWNLILGVFNLLPIPPLDGYWIVRGAVPLEKRIQLDALAVSPWALGVVLLLGGGLMGYIIPYLDTFFFRLIPL